MNLKRDIFSYRRSARSIYGKWFQQSFAAVYAMDRFIGAHPDIDCIIELGTGVGGLSVHLACAMAIRGGTFHTFDNAPERCYGGKIIDHLGTSTEESDLQGFGVARFVMDLYAPESIERIRASITGKGYTLIFCDGGDKPRELAMCAPLLGPGDFLMAHDWQHEVFEKDIPAGWIKYQPWQKQTEDMGTRQLFLKRA